MVVQRVNSGNQKSGLDFGIVVILIFLIIFLARCISIVSKNTERGGLAYVQMLNFSLPVIETQVYNEGAYLENDYSIKNIALEALGLEDITTEKILKAEVPMISDSLMSIDGKLVEYSEYKLGEGSISKYDKTEVPKGIHDDSLKKELNKSKPEVLIYHTHSAENYAESKGPTDNKDQNVVGVGEVIENELEKRYGISVIHDKTKHDVSYNDSYDRSRETAKKYSDKYGNSFKLVIDLHRDGGKNKSAFTQNIKGKDAAKVMFVTTRNSKKFEKNNKVANDLQKLTENTFPGLTRDRMIYNNGINAFNQDIFDNSVIFEIGANINTSSETQYTGELMARVIAEYINGK